LRLSPLKDPMRLAKLKSVIVLSIL
jgi:hypothetical protein